MEPAAPTKVFIIRIWLEPAGGGSRRGGVEHIASRKRRYFAAIADAAEFIAALAAMPLERRPHP